MQIRILLDNFHTMVDAASGQPDVTGIDTLLYLDDSCSMQEGSNLREGHQAQHSLVFVGLEWSVPLTLRTFVVAVIFWHQLR